MPADLPPTVDLNAATATVVTVGDTHRHCADPLVLDVDAEAALVLAADVDLA